ncbi:MAG TPA: sugar phosphate isomerase/epimerase family protein [Sedimentisphaerales bacterium]|nr:sugar phosphate isomerase/epimerase family protein [Sedimentisphaerales bacterium]
MIKSCVTISLVPELAGGPWVYWDEPQISIVKARNAGFDAVELFSAAADAVDSDKLFGLLDENEIRLAAVGTGAGKVLHGLHLVSPDADIRRKACDFVGDMIEFGARFGAPAIIGSMQGRLEPGVEQAQALVWLIEAFNELGGKAADFGVDLLLEPLNRYETDMVNTLSDGAKLIESLNCSSVFLLADLFHMNIEEESISGSIRSAAKHIGHVHWVDSNRRPAGMGHIDLAEAAAALKEIGFDGYASAEALAYPDPDSAAAQTIKAFREFLI